MNSSGFIKMNAFLFLYYNNYIDLRILLCIKCNRFVVVVVSIKKGFPGGYILFAVTCNIISEGGVCVIDVDKKLFFVFNYKL